MGRQESGRERLTGPVDSVRRRLSEALEAGNEAAARVILAVLHPADIADCFDGLDRESRLRAFALLSDAVAAEVIDETGVAATADLLADLDRARLGRVIGQLDTDDAAELLAAVEPDTVAELLRTAPGRKADALTRALEYAPDSAGRLMSTELVALPGSTTAAAAIDEIKRQLPAAPNIYYVYVVDARRHLFGVLSLRALLAAAGPELLADICDPEPVFARDSDDKADVADLLAKYDLLAVPVVDATGCLAGMLTVDDAVDVLIDEGGESLLALSGALGPLARFGALRQTVLRLPWLLVTLVGELFVGLVMGGFLERLEHVLLLAVFVPVVSALAGSVGIQSLAATFEAERIGAARGRLRLLLREFLIGMLLGLLAGTLAGLAAGLWLWDPWFGLMLQLSIFGALSVAAFLGAAVPEAALKLRIDPAGASGPLIATLNDLTALSIYFAVATLLLGWAVPA